MHPQRERLPVAVARLSAGFERVWYGKAQLGGVSVRVDLPVLTRSRCHGCGTGWACGDHHQALNPTPSPPPPHPLPDHPARCSRLMGRHGQVGWCPLVPSRCIAGREVLGATLPL